MASRGKVEANTSIFRRLDEYCASRGEPITNQGSKRFIETKKEDRDFLTDARKVQTLDLSPSLKISRFDHADRSFFVTAGYDLLEIPEGMQEEQLNGGVLTASLYEMELRPIVKPIEVREVVEVSDMGDSGYLGHDFLQLASLFPPIQILSTEPLVKGESANIFLLLCLSDRRRFDHWIDDHLAAALGKMASVSSNAIPYAVLCRAVLDFDPAALFLALYRSLEALYSREKTTGLMSGIGISMDWFQMAQQLELHLGWYPREDQSLEALFQSASETDLSKVLAALNEAPKEGNKPHVTAARRVYALRNALVHYRPFHQSFKFDDIEWCRLCEAMSSLVLDLYTAAPTDASGSARKAPRATRD